jgi:hypothetical protein
MFYPTRTAEKCRYRNAHIFVYNQGLDARGHEIWRRRGLLPPQQTDVCKKCGRTREELEKPAKSEKLKVR